MYELRALVYKSSSAENPQTAGLIMQKPFIAKKLEIKDEDLLLMIPELYTSLASCFGTKLIAKNMALFQFCIDFRILVL